MKLTLAAPLSVLSFVALLSSSVLAQTHMTTPSTGTETEGPAAALIFGWAANQGHRFMDASHADNKPRSIKSISFRSDYRNHNAIGRTWSKVTVHAAHGDYNSIQYNKSSAYTLKDTRTLVFDKTWSFPALSGYPSLNPALWGGVRNSLTFRFSRPWTYNGKDAIFLEFRFSGGVADNNVPWNGPTPAGFEYYLDSMHASAWRGKGKGQTYPKKSTCADSLFGGKLVAAFDTTATVKSGSLYLTMQSYYTAPSSVAVYMLTVAGNPKGLDVGAACNLFYLDPTSPILVFLAATDAKGFGYLSLTAPLAPWMKEFWAQGAWFDSKTAQFKLMPAVQAPVGSTGVIPYVTSYVASKTGFSVWTAAAKGLPYIRYEL
jgi:hypothetical protein